MGKNIFKVRFFYLLLIFICFCFSSSFAQEPAREDAYLIGFLSLGNKDDCYQKWTPTAEYLSENIKEAEFEPVCLAYDEVDVAINSRTIDFAVLNPALYVDHEVTSGIDCLVTISHARGEKTHSYYGGIVFVKPQRDDIADFYNLKNKIIAAVDKRSFGGWISALSEFEESGLNPQKDFKKILFKEDTVSVMRSVLNGEADAGVIRSDFAGKENEEFFDANDFKIIFASAGAEESAGTMSEDRPMISTRLYPDWPFAHLKDVDVSLSEKVSMSLLSIHADDPAAVKGEYAGWTIPMSYRSVHKCLERLNLPPYENLRHRVLEKIVDKYRMVIFIVGVLFFFAVGVVLWVVRLNYKLSESRRRLQHEVNERKAFEKGYVDNSAKLEGVLNAIPYAVIGLEERKIVFANPATEDVFGWEPQELIGKEVSVFHVNAKSCDETGDAILADLKEKGISSLETQCIHKTGKKINCSISVVSVGRNGGHDKVVAVYQDITERKEIEEQLREQKELLSNVISNVSHFIFWKDRNSVYLGCNDALAKVAGLNSSDEIIGKTDYDLAWKKEEADFYREIDQEVMTKGEPILNLEETQQTADGRQTTILTSKVPLKNQEGQVIGILGIFADITYIKRAEEENRRQKIFLEEIVNSLTHPFYVLDINDHSLKMANVAAKMQNLKKCTKCYELVYGKDISCDQDGLDCPIAIVKKTKKPAIIEHVLETEDGKTRYVEIHGYPILNEKGEVDQMIEYSLDVTRRKKSEKDLEEKQKQLELINQNLRTNEKALKEMYSDLENAHKELKNTQSRLIQSEKLASIGQLAAGIAHEINNPAGFINSNLISLEQYMEDFAKLFKQQEILQQTVDSENLDEIKKAEEELERIKKQIDLSFLVKDIGDLITESKDGVDRVKSIVGDLKTFARTDEGAMTTVDLNQVLEGVLNIVWNELKYNAEINKKLEEIPCVRGNAQQLGQVFINLLINASQAFEDKGIIYIRSYADENNCFVEIEDNGSGIPEEILEKIFEPFFTTKPTGKGTGLGLSIGYEIINKHKGEILVQSKQGEGTKFIVSLPAAKSEHKTDQQKDV